jgi:monofunctional biosynthetic peptidoglycan transglycosylase
MATVVATFVNRSLRFLGRIFLNLLKINIFLIVSLHSLLFSWIFFASMSLNFGNPSSVSLMRHRARNSDYTVYKVNFIPLKDIPADFQRMVRVAEDVHFYRHRGVDLEGILNAYRMNRQMGRIAYGGSTITQQLARTVFLNPQKSYLRKYVEMWLAVGMDFFMSKDRIMELYLNYAEWGEGIFGIGNASRYYFLRPLNGLDTDEKMRLVVILSSPLRYSPYNFGNRNILWRRYELLQRFCSPDRNHTLEEDFSFIETQFDYTEIPSLVDDFNDIEGEELSEIDIDNPVGEVRWYEAEDLTEERGTLAGLLDENYIE